MKDAYQITILPEKIQFGVHKSETILEAALRQGVIVPYNCTIASCGTCKSRLLAGEVSYGDTTLYAIDDDDQAAGFVLLCSAKPLSDLVIEILRC